MKALIKVCFSIILIFLLLAGIAYAGVRVLLNTIFQDTPSIAKFETAKLEDLQRIKDIAIDVSQQQNRLTGEPNQISLSERDINLAIGHFGPRQIKIPKNTYAQVRMVDRKAWIDATVSIDQALFPIYEQEKTKLQPWQQKVADHFSPFIKGKYVNASIPLDVHTEVVENQPALITVSHGALTIGGMTLSQEITDQIVNEAMQEARKQRDYQLAVESWQNIRSLEIRDSVLHASFVIPETGGLQVQDYRTLVLETDEIELIDLYLAELNKYPKRGPLTTTLRRLFNFAQMRTTETNNPVSENRAALLSLSQLYGGDQLLELVSQGKIPQQINTPKPFTIYKRPDLAQHWVLSAGATLAAGGNIAELLGVNKELADLLDGRHISAWDLLADKAGVRIAEKATSSAKSARNIQLLLSRARKDSDILPDIGRDFDSANDLFSADELTDLEELIDLYLSQHRLYR